MASKTAIIASDVGGIKDMVKNGETGLLINQKDSKAITKAIITLCKDSALKQQLEQNGKEHIIKIFRWQAVAEQYMVIYENIDKSMGQSSSSLSSPKVSALT
jgi:glycosyltransferase involved in cell wall biosynthesis